MKFKTPIPVSTLVEQYQLEIIGNSKQIATGINELHKVQSGDITFVDHPKYYEKSLSSQATIIIIDKEAPCPKGKTLLIHPNPFSIYDEIVKRERPEKPLECAIHQNVSIHDSAVIEPNVIIANDVVIGKDTYIQANVTIREHTIIGDRVTIQSGSVIGTDAFYYKKHDKKYTKWRSGGRVIIENDVEIGAGCTINKGVSGDTIIGEGSKLDCQIHIGHGVILGKNCLLAAQVGIGGKTIVGDSVTIYGQVGIGQGMTIGDNAVILGKSGITKSIPGNKTYFGYPASEAREKYKELAQLRKLTKE